MGAAMTSKNLDRRRLLTTSLAFGGLAGLGACAAPGARTAPALGLSAQDVPPRLMPIRAHADRLFDITVCLRPFRAKGPRIETEMMGDTRVVHNYGHGGSGWSLSWGSAAMAVGQAMINRPKSIAVIGCGAIGLTSAITAQRQGASVTIYARDQLPQTRSARATGGWTPDSRIALTDAAGPAFAETWEQMARTSFKIYRQYLGLPGNPVQWTDRYSLSDTPFREASEPPGSLDFAHYSDRIRDLTPRAQDIPPAATTFPVKYVRRSETMQFNIANYSHTLMTDFFLAGGKFVRQEFRDPRELTQLAEKTVINCPGYAAREWWNDSSIVPVRGQIAWLIPQPEVRYALSYRDVSTWSRTDGIVVQAVDGGDMNGYDNGREVADRAEADKAVGVLEELYSRFPRA